MSADLSTTTWKAYDKLSRECGDDGCMVAVGQFSGLMISPDSTGDVSFPVIPGMPLPLGDIWYLQKTTAASGKAYICAFPSTAHARAFAGNFAPSGAAGALGSSKVTVMDGQGVTTNGAQVTGASDGIVPAQMLVTFSLPMLYNGASNDMARSDAYLSDGLSPGLYTTGTPVTSALHKVFNDRTLNVDRMRQPDAFSANEQLVQAVSCATTGVKLSYTVPATREARLKGVRGMIGATGGQVLRLELVRSAVTYNLGGDNTAQTALKGITGLGPVQGGAMDLPLSANDIVQINCITAFAASTADLALDIATTRYVI